MKQEAYGIDEDVTLLAFDLLARIIAIRVDAAPPFSAPLDALAFNDAGGWAGFAPHSLSALDVQRVVNVFQRAVVIPQIEIIEERALGRKVYDHVLRVGLRPAPDLGLDLANAGVFAHSLPQGGIPQTTVQALVDRARHEVHPKLAADVRVTCTNGVHR
jgi:hypothetical protein